MNGYNLFILSDFISFNEYTSNLLPGVINEESLESEPQIMMVSIEDGLGGITNITR